MKDDIPKGLRIRMSIRKMCCSELLSPLQDKARSSFYCIFVLCVGSKEVSEKAEWTAADQGAKEIIWDRTFSVSLIQFSLNKDVCTCTRVCVHSVTQSWHFWFCFLCFWYHIQKLIAKTDVKGFFLVLSIRSFTHSGLVFMSLIHFELIL